MLILFQLFSASILPVAFHSPRGKAKSPYVPCGALIPAPITLFLPPTPFVLGSPVIHKRTWLCSAWVSDLPLPIAWILSPPTVPCLPILPPSVLYSNVTFSVGASLAFRPYLKIFPPQHFIFQYLSSLLQALNIIECCRIYTFIFFFVSLQNSLAHYGESSVNVMDEWVCKWTHCVCVPLVFCSWLLLAQMPGEAKWRHCWKKGMEGDGADLERGTPPKDSLLYLAPAHSAPGRPKLIFKEKNNQVYLYLLCP